jgi:methyl-accepting chemotaxis protein
MVDDAAALSDQTSDEVANVSAAAEQQTASLSEVSTSADDLTHVAENLSSLLDEFRVELDAADLDHAAAGAARSTAGSRPVSADGGVDQASTDRDRR